MKDSYWFKHDSNAGRDIKLKRIQHIYTHWGKGIYWDVIEVLREQKDYRFESDESSLQFLSEMIGEKDSGKFVNWFKDCIKFGLFINENGFFYSDSLCQRMNVWESKKSNGKMGGRPSKKDEYKTESETEIKPNEKLIETESKPNRNHKIIEDKIKEDKIIEFLKLKFPKATFNEDKWIECIRLILEIDGYNLEQIRYIVEIFTNDDFWKTVFLSPLKLRQSKDGVKYIDRFAETIKANKQKKEQQNRPGVMSGSIYGNLPKKTYETN